MAGTQKQVKYGLQFPKKWTVLDIELYCFKIGHSPEKGGLGKAEHWWKFVGYVWGKNNIVGNKSKFFIRNPWSEDIINELCEQKYVAVGGAAGTTKSETLALWHLVNYLADARNYLGVMLSTSLKEARKRIWGSLIDFIRAVPAFSTVLKIVDSQGIVRYESPAFKASDRAALALVAAEQSQEKDAIKKLIGMHNKKVFVTADELSELTKALLEYALPGGNLTSNPEYQFSGLANPNSYYDPFGVFWKPKNGYGSINVDSTRWETDYGVGLHFDGMKSPNVLAGRTIYPFLPTIEKIEDAKRAEGGETSLRFWRMIRGFPCPTGQEELIYTEQDIIKFEGDKPPVWADKPLEKCASLDPGFTNGGDRSVVMLGTVGEDKSGIRTLCYDRYVILTEDVTSSEERSFQIARQFMELCQKEKIAVTNCAVDATGAGAPFCDILATVWMPGFLRVQFGGKASDIAVSLTNPKLGHEMYYDRVTEIWYSGKEFLRQGQIKGIMPDLAREMCMRKYGTTGAEKKIYAESKKDMKLRVQRSPDIADAAFILLDLCRQRLQFTPIASEEQVKKRGGGWRNKVKRLNPAYAKGSMRANIYGNQNSTTRLRR